MENCSKDMGFLHGMGLMNGLVSSNCLQSRIKPNFPVWALGRISFVVKVDSYPGPDNSNRGGAFYKNISVKNRNVTIL